MRKISDIYREYKIMPNLQEHMLRVAGVASLICDNINESLNKKDIIIACLLHDVGNITKCDLNYFPEFLEPQGLQYWQNVQNEYKEKYGRDEHEITKKIVKELGLPENIVFMVGKFNFFLLCDASKSNDVVMKIINYSDNRVSPHGVVSYDERMDEAKKRYQNRKDNNLKEEDREKLVSCGKEVEKQIFAKCRIKPKDINNDSVKLKIEKLKDFEI